MKTHSLNIFKEDKYSMLSFICRILKKKKKKVEPESIMVREVEEWSEVD